MRQKFTCLSIARDVVRCDLMPKPFPVKLRAMPVSSSYILSESFLFLNNVRIPSMALLSIKWRFFLIKKG